MHTAQSAAAAAVVAALLLLIADAELARTGKEGGCFVMQM